MQQKNQQTRALRQNLIFALTLMLIGLTETGSAQPPIDSLINKPYSVDSLFITPAMPREGEPVTLYAFVTQTSSPCGLVNYQVTYDDAGNIHVNATYWKGMLTALCQSYDSMYIGSLQAGHYVLNFMNLKSLAFTVYPQPSCKADFSYEYLRCTPGERCLNTIRFTDRSAGFIQTWYWDFGDGTTSDEQNPVHQFPDSGVFQVRLTVAGGLAQECHDTITQSVPTHNWPPQPEVPWIPVNGGDDNHTIVVAEKLGADAGLENGDYIGLFFRDSQGDLRCGDMLRWDGGNGILTAWENTGGNDTIWIMAEPNLYPMPFYKNGFFAGEKFEYKIWKWRENKIIDVEHASYTLNNVFPDSGYYKDDGMSLLTGFSACPSQEIYLNSGWNMVSLHIDPVDPSMKSIFGDADVIVKNYKGEIVYFPYVGLTEGTWNILEGYKVRSTGDVTLRVPGNPVDPRINIPLPGSKKPYFLPYYYGRSYRIQSMMRNVNDNIRYVQTYDNVDGTIRALNYIPQYGIDQIHYMRPGYAYKISFITPMRSFTYPPADEDSIWFGNDGLHSLWVEPLVVPVVDKSDNRILVIPEDVLSIGEGARINIFAGDDLLVGDETAEGGNVAVTLWDLDENEYTMIQMMVAEENGTASYTVDLSRQKEEDGLIILTKEMMTGIDVPGSLTAHRLYPTVAANGVALEIFLEKGSDVTLFIYDMTGNRVRQYGFNGNSGMNHFDFTVGNFANGQYLYSIIAGEKLARGKFQVQH